jgi:hypothetical protein
MRASIRFLAPVYPVAHSWTTERLGRRPLQRAIFQFRSCAEERCGALESVLRVRLVAVSKSLNALSILFPSRISPGSEFVVEARAL